MAEVAEDSNSKFVEALGEVKDQIGVWHDWMELTTIAKQVRNHGRTCPLNKQIQQRARTEFVKALGVANAMRTRFMNNETPRYAGKKNSLVRLNSSLLGATSRPAG